MTIYTDAIRQWASDSRRAGILENADGTGEVGLGKDEIGRRLAVRFTLRLRGDCAETVRYQAFGCGFTIAACAAAAELAEGRTLGEINTITPAVIDAALAGLPAERGYCADLAAAALQAAAKSAAGGSRVAKAGVPAEDDHAPRVTATDPVYRLLLDSPPPPGAPPEDRHLFACLIAVAAGESRALAAVLGLDEYELAELLHLYFPAVSAERLQPYASSAAPAPPAADPGITALLLDYLPQDDDGWTPVPSLWLTRILAARAGQPGHLWRAMGLFARPELTAAIRRHLPALANANSKQMRWKRFLYRQLCEQAGGVMCRAPDCRACSDYAQCFAGEEEAASCPVPPPQAGERHGDDRLRAVTGSRAGAG